MCVCVCVCGNLEINVLIIFLRDCVPLCVIVEHVMYLKVCIILFYFFHKRLPQISHVYNIPFSVNIKAFLFN